MRQGDLRFQLDGHRVVVDRARQVVQVVDARGNLVFRDQLQVAAGSFQGLFTPGKHLAALADSINPAHNA